MEEKYLCSGKYICINDPTLELTIKGSPEGDLLILSTGETTIIDNVWAHPGVDILLPGVEVSWQNGFITDFRKGGLLLKKLSGEILTFKKIE